MRRRAQIESVLRVAAAIGRGVGPGDDGLHLEHPFRDTLVGQLGMDLRQGRRRHVVLERDLAHDERCAFAHLHANRRDLRLRRPRQPHRRDAARRDAHQHRNRARPSHPQHP
jgi:hypothetical protein